MTLEPKTKIHRVLLIGSKHLGLQVLKQMHTLSPDSLAGVITLDDVADSRSVLGEFSLFCAPNDIDMHIVGDKKRCDHLIREIKPDLCIVVGWYWLISREILSIVPHGFIGIHNSLLPRYRGGSPLVWQIINREKEIGFSMFSFTPGMDDGPIWAQASVPLLESDYVDTVLEKLEKETLAAFSSIYPKILGGTAHALSQRNDLATYCAQRLPIDGNIDWNLPAQAARDFVRAQSEPYPGAFTHLDGKKLTIWRAEIFPYPYCGTPGQIAKIAVDGVYVICGGHTALILTDVQLEDRRGRAHELIRSIKSRLSFHSET